MLVCIPSAYFTIRGANKSWATPILIGWIFALNCLSFADSVIWAGDNPDEWWEGQIYCDVNARIKHSFSIGVPGAAVGMFRFLADATNPKSGPEGLEATRRQRNIMDFTFGIIFPVVNTLLDFIISPARYAIMGVYGCTGLNSQTWPQVPLFSLWSLILAFTAAVYACMFCVVRY
jgi:pheromone a factor receptor